MKNFIKKIGLVTLISSGIMAPIYSFADNSQNNDSSQPSIVDNQSTKFKLSSKLNDMYPNSNIEVTVFNNEVLLTGQVKEPSIKQSAGQVASTFPDVKSVKNYLTIGKKQTAEVTRSDSLITTKVAAKLLTISGVDSNDIKVVTTNHVVYLLGDVTKTEATAVINNVKKINGVKKVVSLLNVTSDS